MARVLECAHSTQKRPQQKRDSEEGVIRKRVTKSKKKRNEIPCNAPYGRRIKGNEFCHRNYLDPVASWLFPHGQLSSEKKRNGACVLTQVTERHLFGTIRRQSAYPMAFERDRALTTKEEDRSG